MLKAADTEDWRNRYLDSVKSMDIEERQNRSQQQVLRNLVGRLCLAAQGQSARLDNQLNRLKDAVNREAASAQLEPFGQAIADAVKAIDGGAVARPATAQAAADPPAVRPSGPAEVAGERRIRDLLSQLLGELGNEQQLAGAADAIRPELAVVMVPEKLPGLVERVGALVTQRIQELERARQGFEQLLGQLACQLEVMQRYVDGNASEEMLRNSSSETLQVQIIDEMEVLGQNMAIGLDVSQIQRNLQQRLDAIGRHLQDFRIREQDRVRQVRSRTELLHDRMAEMESEARRLKERLTDERRLSMLDPLTQIPNRLAYEKRAGEALDRWTQFAEPACLALWDIDRFKTINDQYGHRAGDRVLTVVAECLAQSIRSTDFVARYGGEEFVMLLPGTTLTDALPMAEQVRAAVAQLGFHFRGTPVSITISGGIAALQEGGAASAFDRADSAMYKAKNAGRNQVVSA
ncbi:MAG: GGDEF domain-containing protein [Pseudomonadota bacterium]